ncbi:cell surface glycoprotein CD200 receptor 1 [Phodopus roborovskii]|uniref:cell surface glycoprotein CD200 receptor 1 n=1 Tax=Phodopus roborovskii TaxID=109678 RepID=UPI0021E3B9BB|nr:cell surface glycoprotein CD200 receptor 1 [Phodopus roborovskii]
MVKRCYHAEANGRAERAGHGHCCTCEEKKNRVSSRNQKPEMRCFWRTSDLVVLLIWGVLVAESSCMNGNQTSLNSSLLKTEVSTPVSVQMGTKAQLCCPPISLTKTVLITWKITLRGQPPCTISYKVATKEISEANCTDRRITWASTPGQSPHLQINTVALSHDGQYLCEVASHEGHYQERHDLHVVVPPEVTLFPGKNRTVVCEAIAGRPAAQIFWAPDGYHVTENESHSNGTVTVRSTYHREPNNESAVLCFVSHVTGNKTLQITLNRGGKALLRLYISYIIPPILTSILIIVGCIWLLKFSGFRKCKRTRPDASPVVEEGF